MRRAGGPLSVTARAGPWVGGLTLLLLPVRAWADHCDAPARPDASPVRASVRGEVGHFDTATDEGSYAGVVPGLSLGKGPVRARAELGVYRLSPPGGVESGPGDLETKLEETFFTPRPFAFGAALGASFPTGSAEKRLGMGHVMASPSVFATFEVPRWFVAAELGTASALGEHDERDVEPDGHHHDPAAPGGAHEHAHDPPIPNPMFTEELSLAATASYELFPWLRLNGSALGALSLIRGDAPPGRVTLNGGVEIPFGFVIASAGAKVDVLGATRRELLIVGFVLRGDQ